MGAGPGGERKGGVGERVRRVGKKALPDESRLPGGPCGASEGWRTRQSSREGKGRQGLPPGRRFRGMRGQPTGPNDESRLKTAGHAACW